MTDPYLKFMGWATSYPPPYKIENINFYAFVFPVDHRACQKFLDDTYNQVAGYQRFRLDFHCTFVLIMKSPRLSATTPPYDLQGGLPETDVGFWFLVSSYDRGKSVPSDIKFMPGLLLVDDCYAVQLGRELYGYPKYQAKITAPDRSLQRSFYRDRAADRQVQQNRHRQRADVSRTARQRALPNQANRVARRYISPTMRECKSQASRGRRRERRSTGVYRQCRRHSLSGVFLQTVPLRRRRR